MERLYYYTSGIIFILLYFFLGEGVSENLIYISLINFVIVFCLLLRRRFGEGRVIYFRTDLLFLIFYYIVFFALYHGYVMGYNSLNSRWLSGFEHRTNHALCLSSIGLLSFGLGLSRVSNFRLGRRRLIIGISSKRSEVNFITAGLAVLLAVGLTYFLRFHLTDLVFEAYSGSQTGVVLVDGVFLVIQILAMMLAALVIYMRMYQGRFNFVSWIYMSLIAIWIGLLLLIGDRNSFFLIVIVFFGGYWTFISRVKFIYLALGIVCALFIYTFIEQTRKMDISGLLQGQEVMSELTSNRSSFFSEENSFFLSSVGVRATIYVVNELDGFYYGLFKLFGFLGMFPFLLGFLFSDIPFDTTSSYLTYKISGTNAAFGLGTNIVSDLYIDFGLFGVITLMYLLGNVVSLMNSSATREMSPYGLITYLIAVATISESVRYSYLFPLKYFFWSSLIYFGLKQIFFILHPND